MAFVQVNPGYRDQLDALGLRTAEQFLALPGVVVSGHPDRHVMRSTLGSLSVFLKREHRVRWHDRLASWRAGFGWATKSGREAMTLQALERAGVGCAEWMACGEDGRGHAFLLVRALTDAMELRCFLRARRGAQPRQRFARRLGVALAQLHDARFDHPDLYAKHVFVGTTDEKVYFLDWQRSRRGAVNRHRRVRDLAALDATLADELATGRERLACLRAYVASTQCHARTKQQAEHKLGRLISAIRRQSEHLLHKRHIRAARLPPAADPQELIWLDGEALCITPRFLHELNGAVPDWLRLEQTRWDGRETTRALVALPGGRQGLLIRSRRDQPLRWLWTEFRRRPLRTAEVRQAGVLFRQQRQGQAAPRLLAFGQRWPLPWRTESFLLTEAPGLEDGREP